MSATRRVPAAHALDIIATVMKGWSLRLNTHDMAQRIGLPEAVVANALQRGRDQERGQ